MHKAAEKGLGKVHDEGSLTSRVREFLRQCDVVERENEADAWKTMFGLTLLAILGFATMSVLNVVQQTTYMFVLTCGSAIVLALGCVVAFPKKRTQVLRITIVLVCGVVFSCFVIRAGNEGFAALWLILVPLISMNIVGFGYGFVLSAYFLIFLVLFFYTPLSGFLHEGFTPMFMLRFPFLYLGACALGVWLSVRLTTTRYKSIMQNRELERISSTDALTGLFNRYGFNRYMESLDVKSLKSISVLYTDVNGLHELNNSLGHKAGDELLCTIAQDFAAVFEDYATFRIGGDEFVAICPECGEPCIEKRAKAFREVVREKGYNVATGYATWTKGVDGEYPDIEALSLKADNIMLEKKRDFYKQNPEHDRRKN